jgi:hypothetical protein
LADGAAIAPLPMRANSRNSACATGCAGQRMPTVSCEPVTASGTLVERRRISVSGPGQNHSTSDRASPDMPTTHPVECARVGDVHDERMIGGPALQREDARDRERIGRVGAQAVDGLRRERHHVARSQHAGRALDRVIAGHDARRALRAAW